VDAADITDVTATVIADDIDTSSVTRMSTAMPLRSLADLPASARVAEGSFGQRGGDQRTAVGWSSPQRDGDTSEEALVMSTPEADRPLYPPLRPQVTAEELLAAKGTQPIRSLDDLAADTFDSDDELDEFLAFTYAERRRDVA
jgi:hypothetical protein